ncbi:MAG: DUF4012 domain-containing protein [Candidatus Portnoybacteria bacterium]|nr:DUF4012 domain-containing protein [Candidatus Portnoybacteria bacterium]MDD4982547.1 DUF4012 domain-containing protein [Candidatus Portnoybacteria bacterium]
MKPQYDISMRHKRINNHGDFGMEKAEQDLAGFAPLKMIVGGNSVGRVVDLRMARPGVFLAVKKEIIRQKRGRKKKSALEIKSVVEHPTGTMELFKRFRQGKTAIFEPLEISHPERADIVAKMEEIEAINNLLKNHIWRAGVENIKAPENIFEPVADLPEIADIEQYLWAKQEPDILEELLAEPDMAIAGSNIEIADNPVPPPFNLKGGKEEIMVEDGAEFILSDNGIEQSDFLARWRQKQNKAKIAPLISGSRKFWSGKRKEPQEWAGGAARRGAGFLSAGFIIYLVIFGMSLAGRGLLAKENILSSALQAYKSMLAAKDSASSLNFSAAGVDFETAYQNFLAADQELNKMGRGIIYVLEKLPGGSVVGSGAALVDTGENFAKAGRSFAKIADIFLVQNLGDYFSASGPSLTQKIAEAQSEIEKAQIALAAAGSSLAKVNINDLPADVAPQIASLKEKMHPLLEVAGQLKNWSNVFLEVLGHEHAKKYLLVFQNNSEARPTGGFIGTYGVVDLDEGRMKNLFIDGIFNLDGQLYDKVVPPGPIQKISTAWSTHDANWFADFPTSTRKIMGFYEKAGGQTVDGVISLTPTVVERLLALTGPINLPQYNIILDQNNFLDLTQYKVEVDYDKQQNQPKKILADFAPLFLEKLWQIWPQKGQEIMQVLVDSLAQKHTMFYFTDPSLEKTFVDQGWAGEILSTEKDYLSVINTNINGFKTDRVIDQKIYHTADIQTDGSIIDTVKIVRAHNGGKSQYDWYNKVNADYLRVYVPLGSKLISAQGQTLEINSAPIDYAAQKFAVDPDVAKEEGNMQTDQNSGTQIFEESGKTVFGNWAYVSPGESVEISYQYLLPFKLSLAEQNFTYSLLAQKQSGSIASGLESILNLPADYKINWQYPADLQISGRQIKFSGELKTDKFYGVAFGK